MSGKGIDTLSRCVDQQSVRDEKARMGRPGIDPVTPFPPDASDVLLVEDLEHHSEAIFQLFLPLKEHRRRAGHKYVPHLLANQEFPSDQTGLDRLAETDIIGDEKIHPGQSQGLLQRFQLIGVDPDAGSEWRLKQVRVGRGQAVPLQGVQVSRDVVRCQLARTGWPGVRAS